VLKQRSPAIATLVHTKLRRLEVVLVSARALHIKRTATAIPVHPALLPTVATHQLAGVKIPAHFVAFRWPCADHPGNLFVLIVNVKNYHHKNPSRLLYSPYTNEIGI
jgi:hypothetical protein